MKHAVRIRLAKPLGLLEELLSKPPEKINAAYPTFHGVYAISDEEDSCVIYVGMTKTGADGIGQRLYDHLNNNGVSDLKTFLGGDKEKAGECHVRYIEVLEYLDRRNLESLAIAVLSPKHNK